MMDTDHQMHTIGKNIKLHKNQTQLLKFRHFPTIHKKFVQYTCIQFIYKHEENEIRMPDIQI